MISRALAALAHNPGSALAASLLAGVLVPSLSAALRPFLVASVVALLFLALLRMEWGRESRTCRRPLVLLAGVLWLMVGAPILVNVFARGLGLDPVLTAAAVLAASAPPLMASPAFALLLGLDAALCVTVLLVGTLAAPLSVTLVSAEFLSVGDASGPLDLIVPLGLMIAGAAAAAWLVRKAVGGGRVKAASASLGGVSVLALMVLSIASMHGVLARFEADPNGVLELLLAAFVLNLALQAITAVLFSALGRMRALTMAFCGGNRNVLLFLTIIPAHAHPDIALFFALAQIPMYLLPVLLRPVYRRLVEEPVAAFDLGTCPSFMARRALALRTPAAGALAGAPAIEPLSAEDY